MANVFQQFLQPVKSVAEYDNDYLRNDAIRNQNALQQLTIQGEQQSRQASAAKANALQRIAAQSQGDPTAYATGLRQAGFMADADAADTSRAKIGETNSVTGKNNAETAQKQYDLHRAVIDHGIQSVSQSSSPDLARKAIADGVSQGYWSMEDAQKKIASVPDDPQQYQQWRMGQIAQLMSAHDQFEANKPKIDTFNTGGAQVTQSVDPITQQVTRLGAVPITQSADSKASTGLGYAKLGEEKRHNGATEAQATAGGANKPLTEGQAKALGFGSRMQEAEKLLQGFSANGVDRPGAIKSTLESIPLVGGALGTVANGTQSSDQQGVEQAQRDFLNAILRRESGAAIGKEEFDSARKQYFPSVLDDAPTKAQKARNRAIAIQGVLAEVPSGQRDSLSAPPASAAPAPLGIHPDAIAAELARRGGK